MTDILQINKFLFIVCLVLAGCSRDSVSPKHQDDISVYGNLLMELPGGEHSFALGPGVRPDYDNDLVARLQNRPFTVPDFSVAIAGELSGSSSTAETLHLLHRFNSLSAGGYGPPVTGTGRWKKGRDPAGNIMEDFLRFTAGPADGGAGLIIDRETESELNSLNEEAVQMLADLLKMTSVLLRLSACSSDEGLLSELRRSDPSYATLENRELLTIPFSERELYSNHHRKFFNTVDAEMIAFGSRIMVEEVNAIAGRYKTLVANGDISLDKPLILRTRYGRIQLLTGGQDTIRMPSLISLDPGGDDHYWCSAAVTDGDNTPVSISIDLGGDDVYGDGDSATVVCSAACGMSYLLDMEGDDLYISGASGVAFAVAGCAVLDDRSGDDRYSCTGKYGAASAFFGEALLVDHRGNDTYSAGSYSMGFGGTGGAALLIDYDGDDKYLSSESSFTMGASAGRWADATDGLSMGGGVGMLLDCKGDDHYSSGWFSQGASYYFGLGILVDMTGDDCYNSVTHSQGTAVHTSLALLADLSGNDKYNPGADSSRLTQSIGYGRDRSAAFFIEQSGDDRFLFGNKSFGVGDIHSLGFAVDCSGNDSYTWYDNHVYKQSGSFGSAQVLDKGMAIHTGTAVATDKWCAGAAHDLKGKDSYLCLSDDRGPVRFFRNRKSIKKSIESTFSVRQDR
jgi:hypothetical protein